MKGVTGRKFAKALERKGWKLIRISGSHHIYGKAGSIVHISILIHGNKDLKAGLLKHFLIQSGLKEGDL
jgi:predicted RNA binding protein YcfA (HicA-like mRNA interferase family)